MGRSIPLVLKTVPHDLRGRVLTDLRISVVDRCNFRCPYCMPEDEYPRDHQFLSKAERLRFEEIERLARIFVGLGVRKLRLTGGEPLLRRDLPELVRQLAAIPGADDLALTTNGSLLADKATPLRAAGLKRITLSLDTLDPETFRTMSGGRGDVDAVLGAIAAAERAGFAPLKINAVVMRGVNDAHALDLVEHFRGTGHIVRFIEYMDVGTCNAWQRDLVVPSAELRARIAARWPLVPLAANYGGEVAQRYAFADGAGEIGFIGSVTEPFCGDCSRARLSADGRLYTCLFARSGHDLRGPLRAGASDEEMAGLIRAVWEAREDRYSEIRSEQRGTERRRIEMYEIGG
ncbi:MAG TPA: GTP 3',8-cyclase MoaA [Rhodanobacteraceae bacterium]|nr:GTP 3',8-cyclase MoaA [Rhodanobacteraceae bacterium]